MPIKSENTTASRKRGKPKDFSLSTTTSKRHKKSKKSPQLADQEVKAEGVQKVLDFSIADDDKGGLETRVKGKVRTPKAAAGPVARADDSPYLFEENGRLRKQVEDLLQKVDDLNKEVTTTKTEAVSAIGTLKVFQEGLSWTSRGKE